MLIPTTLLFYNGNSMSILGIAPADSTSPLSPLLLDLSLSRTVHSPPPACSLASFSVSAASTVPGRRCCVLWECVGDMEGEKDEVATAVAAAPTPAAAAPAAAAAPIAASAATAAPAAATAAPAAAAAACLSALSLPLYHPPPPPPLHPAALLLP